MPSLLAGHDVARARASQLGSIVSNRLRCVNRSDARDLCRRRTSWRRSNRSGRKPSERPDGWADRIANTTLDQRQPPSPPDWVAVGARCRVPARLIVDRRHGGSLRRAATAVPGRRRHPRARSTVAAIGEPLPPVRHLFLIRTWQHEQVSAQIPDVRECQLDDMMRTRRSGELQRGNHVIHGR
jgi:hypothetical protein